MSYKSVFLCLCFVLLTFFALTAFGEKADLSQDLIERSVISYAAYGKRDEEALRQLAETDPDRYQKWNRIMDLWAAPVTVNPALPDDLPDDDTLCLTALGFQLNPDGTMREELIERLKVLKAAA